MGTGRWEGEKLGQKVVEGRNGASKVLSGERVQRWER